VEYEVLLSWFGGGHRLYSWVVLVLSFRMASSHYEGVLQYTSALVLNLSCLGQSNLDGVGLAKLILGHLVIDSSAAIRLDVLQQV
jgi:hypothetical protein